MANGSPSFSATGAPQLRSGIFNYLQGFIPRMTQAGQDSAAALRTAATNPGWASAATNAERTAAGNYLQGSPELDRAVATGRAATMADAANQGARIRSEYTKNGMDFSTGAQQAEQSNNAAAGAQANATSANAYLQNYLAERQNQNQAGAQLGQAQAGPLSYLGGISGALTQPLSQAGNLLSGLSSGGQVYQTGQSGVYNPSLGSNIMNGFSGVMGSL